MNRILTFLLRLLSYLPFWVLYGISDLLYFSLYKVFGYRRKVVLENLRNSFPEKSPDEINKISDLFYKNLCDLIVESVKMISISKEELLKRNDCSMHRVLDEQNAKGRSCFYFAGHLGNWEWSCGVVSLVSKTKVWGVYKTVTNKSFDDLITNYRSRFGCEMITMEQIARRTLSDKEIKNICFVADQTPSNTGVNTWVNFLNQETLAFGASAKLAKKLNVAIIYGSILKVKRGYYKYHFEILFEEPKLVDEQVIMQAFFTRLEKDIIETPESWLWSHKRWKHKRE